MANVRLCFYFLVLVLQYRLVAPEPTFGTKIWCNMFCGDEDEDDSLDDSDDYYDWFDVCFGCPPGKAKTPPETTEASAAPADEPAAAESPETVLPGGVKIMIPPSKGQKLSVVSSPSGSVQINLMPWGSADPAAPATAAPADPAATPAATTAAGDATTAAAVATTAAAGATTAAPTTAAKA